LSPAIIRLPPGCHRVSNTSLGMTVVIETSPHDGYRTASA
jgi:hypothetical protein